MEGSQARPIIVKKKRKKHAEHHGGSWKVAYADFVTAMMAFFLLMWLLAMASPEKRIAVSLYFRNFDIFNIGTSLSGQSFMSGSKLAIDRGDTGDGMRKASKQGKQASQTKVQALSPEDLSKRLNNAVNERLHSVRNQVLVDITGEGVRIQIVDAEGSPMFSSGSPSPTQKAQDILKLVAENIIDIPNRIAIEGHTDAAPFRSAQITNWELSTDRASSARRILEANGIEPERIARVVGYADQELFIKLDPNDPRNRRISIILQKPLVPRE
jgi:chemotaxis protein MotB